MKEETEIEQHVTWIRGLPKFTPCAPVNERVLSSSLPADMERKQPSETDTFIVDTEIATSSVTVKRS